MDQEIKPFSKIVEELVLQISHKDKPSNKQKEEVQKKYKNFGVDKAPYFMNFGIDDSEAENTFNENSWTYDYCKPFDDNLSQHLICFCLNQYQKFCNTQPETYVDIGCGNGGPTTMIVDKVKPKKAIGLDLGLEQTSQANYHYNKQPPLKFMQADAEHLPLATSSVDLITNFESSHLYPNVNCFFQEVARVLKPNGYFIYTDFFSCSEHIKHINNELLKKPNVFKVIYTENITDKVCKSIYKRIVVNERSFIQHVHRTIKGDIKTIIDFAAPMSVLCGALFLTCEQINQLSPLFRNRLLALKEHLQEHIKHPRKTYAFYLLKRIGNQQNE